MTETWRFSMGSPPSQGSFTGTSTHSCLEFFIGQCLFARDLVDCPRPYNAQDGMEAGNIIAWVDDQMDEARRLTPTTVATVAPWTPWIPQPVTPRTTTMKTPLKPWNPRPETTPRTTTPRTPWTPGTQKPVTQKPTTPAEPSVTTTDATTLPPSIPAEVACNRRCSKIFSLVCGNNGRTYNNLCLLELDACQTGLDILVVQEGRCEGEIIEDIFNVTTIVVPIVCTRTEFTCTVDQSCISYIQRCNGQDDCPDGQVNVSSQSSKNILCLTFRTKQVVRANAAPHSLGKYLTSGKIHMCSP